MDAARRRPEMNGGPAALSDRRARRRPNLVPSPPEPILSG
ncbi:hypothetical protein L810_3838 [Burkholderia sp. AU4i]|nr:hypothetical protein L810_3838 [Burkholderia sp. AU4i]MDW9248732.1 hypothetical protein [Burkholderia cepacia]QOH38009.1 hypothetical protein C7S14_1211 [Burkholderia cepacia]